MSKLIRILFIGDIIGRPGRTIVLKNISSLRARHQLDFIIANAENAAGGMGLTKALAEELLAAGLDGITLGNHVWDQRGFEVDINHLPRVCRPANLKEGAPGAAYLILENENHKIAIFTLLGRHGMGMESQDGLQVAEVLLKKLKQRVQTILVEIHADFTAEKQGLGFALDGRVAAVFGTHTHVPTADARILPRGTAFQTDVGMSGVRNSIIGFDPAPIIAQKQDSLPRRWSVADGKAHIDGILLEIDSRTGLAVGCERFLFEETDA